MHLLMCLYSNYVIKLDKNLMVVIQSCLFITERRPPKRKLTPKEYTLEEEEEIHAKYMKRFNENLKWGFQTFYMNPNYCQLSMCSIRWKGLYVMFTVTGAMIGYWLSKIACWQMLLLQSAHREKTPGCLFLCLERHQTELHFPSSVANRTVL